MKLAVVYGENKGGLPPQKKSRTMLQGILIVVAFLVVAALMMTKKIPTLLALPLMAVVICIIAGVPMFGKNADGAEIGWLTTVFEAGTVRMGSAIMATIFGAWLGQLMNKTGVTENIIKKSAELGGDRPLVVTLIMVVATAVLFTTLSGLGSIIMVGSIVLPHSASEMHFCGCLCPMESAAKV